MLVRLIIFLIINFAALGLGSYFTTDGVASEWYANLAKAPWTPPGWVFGATWTLIMVCFSVYMAYAWEAFKNKGMLLTLFAIQWVLNVSWNFIFFDFHQILVGLIVISSLTLLMVYFLTGFWSKLKTKSLLLIPYVVWLIIATSLNAYAFLYN